MMRTGDRKILEAIANQAPLSTLKSIHDEYYGRYKKQGLPNRAMPYAAKYGNFEAVTFTVEHSDGLCSHDLGALMCKFVEPSESLLTDVDNAVTNPDAATPVLRLVRAVVAKLKPTQHQYHMVKLLEFPGKLSVTHFKVLHHLCGLVPHGGCFNPLAKLAPADFDDVHEIIKGMVEKGLLKHGKGRCKDITLHAGTVVDVVQMLRPNEGWVLRFKQMEAIGVTADLLTFTQAADELKRQDVNGMTATVHSNLSKSDERAFYKWVEKKRPELKTAPGTSVMSSAIKKPRKDHSKRSKQ